MLNYLTFASFDYEHTYLKVIKETSLWRYSRYLRFYFVLLHV